MKIAVLATSRKSHERRRPIHPDHLAPIPEGIRQQLFFESGYGLPFGVFDEDITALSAGIGDREELLSTSDLVILAKPVAEDARQMKPGATLWGWIHCVQGVEVTQAAIDRQLTFITWETMNHWNDDGSFQSHIFSGNNQIAGYAAVLHALTLRGTDGFFGGPKQVVLINTGQVSRGALRALKALGFSDVALVTPQPLSSLPSEFSECRLHALQYTASSPLMVSPADGASFPLIELLAESDIIVNGIFQNPLSPLHFVRPGEEACLKTNALIIDVSCDTAMGFPFAAATSFDAPIRRVGQIDYYGVDHTPSFLWESATWQISNAIIPYLSSAISNLTGGKSHSLLDRATEIRGGEILNSDILVFQDRENKGPYSRRNP